MQRKVPYKLQDVNTGDSARFDEFAARHVEAFSEGLAIAISSRGWFGYDKPGTGEVATPRVRVRMSVFHFGQPVLSIDRGVFKFRDRAAKASYLVACTITIGGQRVSVGFSGKSVKYSPTPSRSALPGYLHLKIEPV